MKTNQATAGPSPGRGWSSTGLGLFAATVFALLPVHSRAADAPPSPDGGGGALASGGDETVGTLPIVGGGRGTLDYNRFQRGTRSGFYLEGSVSDLHNAVLLAQGSGYVSAETLDVAGTRVRLVFHGSLQVTIDRQAVHDGSVTVGLSVPRGFGSGRMAVSSGGGATTRAALNPGLLALPILAMESRGVLDSGALQILAVARTGERTLHRVEVGSGVVILSQSY